MKTNLLEIRNLKKIYHDKDGEILAIKDISFKIKEGEFIAIVGPSGCGKSTILSILSDLENKSDGEIIISKSNLKIGYMLQNDALFDNRTILKNTLIGLEVNKNLNDEKEEKVLDLLNTYGLSEFIDKYPRNLSGGMRQRVV